MDKKTSLNIKYKEYIEDGNENTIVVLHGWGGSSSSWEEFGEIISKNGFNVIIPDLPGFGETKLNYEFNLNEYTKVIIEFIKELNLGEIILMGHSNGGAISVKIANSGEINISNLVLNNSAGIRKDTKRSIKRKVLNKFATIFKKLSFLPGYEKIRKLLYKIIGGQDYLNTENNILLKKTYLNIINEDISEEIKKVDLNTLLIRGEKDTYTPISDAYIFRNSIKKSKLCILENETHGIHLKNPKKLIETFLKNI